MTTNDTRTQERIEQAVAAHLDSATPERYAYIMKHLGPWTDGYLTRDAEPTTVTAEQIEKACDGFYSDTHGLLDWSRMSVVEPHLGDKYRAGMTRAFRAAGFRIEGDPA